MGKVESMIRLGDTGFLFDPFTTKTSSDFSTAYLTTEPEKKLIIRRVPIKQNIDAVRIEEFENIISSLRQIDSVLLLKPVLFCRSEKNLYLIQESYACSKVIEVQELETVLQTLVWQNKHFSEKNVLAFLQQFCEQYQKARVAAKNNQNIAHGNLCPQKINLFSSDSILNYRIKDFYYAHILHPINPDSFQTNMEYLTEEQLQNYFPANEAEDMWALGMICFKMLRGIKTNPYVDEKILKLTNIEYSQKLKIAKRMNCFAIESPQLYHILEHLLDKNKQTRLRFDQLVSCLKEHHYELPQILPLEKYNEQILKEKFLNKKILEASTIVRVEKLLRNSPKFEQINVFDEEAFKRLLKSRLEENPQSFVPEILPKQFPSLDVKTLVQQTDEFSVNQVINGEDQTQDAHIALEQPGVSNDRNCDLFEPRISVRLVQIVVPSDLEIFQNIRNYLESVINVLGDHFYKNIANMKVNSLFSGFLNNPNITAELQTQRKQLAILIYCFLLTEVTNQFGFPGLIQAFPQLSGIENYKKLLRTELKQLLAKKSEIFDYKLSNYFTPKQISQLSVNSLITSRFESIAQNPLEIAEDQILIPETIHLLKQKLDLTLQPVLFKDGRKNPQKYQTLITYFVSLYECLQDCQNQQMVIDFNKIKKFIVFTQSRSVLQSEEDFKTLKTQ